MMGKLSFNPTQQLGCRLGRCRYFRSLAFSYLSRMLYALQPWVICSLYRLSIVPHPHCPTPSLRGLVYLKRSTEPSTRLLNHTWVTLTLITRESVQNFILDDNNRIWLLLTRHRFPGVSSNI